MIKRILTITAIVIVVLALLILLTLFCLFYSEIRTLNSVHEQNDHPLYTMTYYADYGFDGFLEQGAKSDREMEEYVTKHILKGIPIDFGVYDHAGCTAFVAQNETGQWIYGRNFDFSYAPVMILETYPENGYASISTVNLSFAGLDQESMGNSLTGFRHWRRPILPLTA